jgi:NAD(P)H-flavin reductase/ferredoxin
MKVRFEPIGEEIHCSADETVLDAAFRHGYNLVYGCREGQCSACKCYLLEGDVALKAYSTFALSESEQANGYSLMCRAMPERDLVIELLHYDPDAYRLEHPIRDLVGIVEVVESLTRDIWRLVLHADGFAFTPGQYVDLHVDGERRSFSMANIDDGRIELIIKRYPGGRFSGKLGGALQPGDEVGFTGPYGSLHAREGDRPILMIAGGSGLAPILSLLRQLAAEGCERPIRFFYGARAEDDLFGVEEIGALALADFEFTPVVGGFVHESVDVFMAGGSFTSPDVYMCGPPPMVEAAEEMLIGKHKLDEQRIFCDKFTASAAASVSAPAAPSDPERSFPWYEPRRRRATQYEDVTVDTQPSVHRHVTRGWSLSFEDGRGTWSDDSTRLRSGDWFAFRDPGEQWERPFYQRETAVEQQIEGAIRSAVHEGLIEDFTPAWVGFLRAFLQTPAYVEHGLWFALATAARDCLSDTVATCVCLEAAMKQRSAQAIVLYAMDLEQALDGGFPIEPARASFLSDPPWQPTRSYVERLASVADWGEVIIAANLCFEPTVGTLIRREFGIRAAAANGDTVTPTLARVATQEWEWTRAWTLDLVRFLFDDAEFGAANREVVGGWVGGWMPRSIAAAATLAPITEGLPAGIDAGQALARVRAYGREMLFEVGLDERVDWDADVRVAEELPIVAPAPEPAPSRAPRPAASMAVADAGGSTYDYVGIVMAKSAEGDAVAAILRERPGIEVIEQPSFWDIRAAGRLVIPYDVVSERLGYEIDAYSIQHEMSTHYGRMVAGDDALMLFSDPTEAMQYLIS